MIAFGLTLALAGVILLALGREFDRLDRQRRMRAYLMTNPQALRLRRGFVELTISIQDNFTPALSRMAASLQEFGKAANKEQDQ